MHMQVGAGGSWSLRYYRLVLRAIRFSAASILVVDVVLFAFIINDIVGGYGLYGFEGLVLSVLFFLVSLGVFLGAGFVLRRLPLK